MPIVIALVLAACLSITLAYRLLRVAVEGFEPARPEYEPEREARRD